jgi:hypothetical protein
MKTIQKDLQGAYNLLQLVMLLLIFPMVLVWIWTWIFEYTSLQKVFSALWIIFILYLTLIIL